uniref:Fibronectin type-III domain-containing protein n=1 Tax=Neogobius melanostomus TaxID=47308 RepID=A0A8C6UUC1_9GOBI
MLLLLLLLLLWTAMLSSTARAQSGDVDTDMEPTVSCTSHISVYEGSNISCRLISRDYALDDDEDEDADTIKNMTACCRGLREITRCVTVLGDTLSTKKLNPVLLITLTAVSKRVLCVLLFPKVKPKSPQVYNVTLNQDQALVRVQIPYHKDYLNEDNLRFQLQLWSEKTNQTQNMTSGSMNIGRNHLHSGTQYHVKARAIPQGIFQGTWSEWSQPYTFHTEDAMKDTTQGLHKRSIVTSFEVRIVLMVVSVVLLWMKKILTYMWPSIPHPKTTFEQIRGPNNALLLFYIPEEFSSLNVYTSVSQSAGPSSSEKEPVLSSAGTDELLSCSTQSTDASLSTSSAGTEELELLSHSSTSEEGQDVSDGLSTENTDPEEPETSPTEHNGAQNVRDNSYVTMSSFYQIKTAGTADGAAPIK